MESDFEHNIGNIFKMRYHGAYNIRGIPFQMLYTVFRAFDLYNDDFSFIRPEGIEDIDLIGLSLDGEYIQVKTSKNKWNWNELKKVIPNFYSVFKEEPNSNFTLIISADVDGNVEKLMHFSSLSGKEKTHVLRKLRKMAEKLELSFDELNNFVEHLI